MSSDGKTRIIEAAKRVIIKNGIAGATMRGIAEEAGLSTGAIYHYYGSKEQVLYDVMDESLSESKRIAEESRRGETTKEELINEIYENILKRFKKKDENRVQFYLAQEAILGNSELKDKLKEKYKEWICKTEDLFQSMYGKEQTKYNKAFATLLIGAIDGVILQLMLNANPAELEDIAKVYHEILKEGIPKFIDHLSRMEK